MDMPIDTILHFLAVHITNDIPCLLSKRERERDAGEIYTQQSEVNFSALISVL